MMLLNHALIDAVPCPWCHHKVSLKRNYIKHQDANGHMCERLARLFQELKFKYTLIINI